MSDTSTQKNFFDTQVLGHPAGLFVLFFTEMWERFSYYGMRAILVLFLTGAVTGDNPGWAWSTEAALSLLGTYAMLVYLTPIIGGWLADNYLGYRKAVVIGAVLMTLGHAAMAAETHTSLYIGIALLIAGNGFFKPNMTSIISKMYEGHDEKKDGAFNLFYMGVNAGAFLGIMLCGWVGENISWSYGFGLAGIFMFLGMLQFYFAQNLFGNLGDPPSKEQREENFKSIEDFEKIDLKLNPFQPIDYVLLIIFVLSALIFIFNDPLSKIGNLQFLNFHFLGLSDSLSFAIIAAIAFVLLIIIRISRYSVLIRDRMIAFVIFCIFTIFFWAAFEQAAGSLPIYTRDYVQRALDGNWALVFKIVDLLVTVVPIGIITYVLISLFNKTHHRIPLSNIILGSSFLIIWGLVIYKIYIEFQNSEAEVPITWFAILNSLFIIIFAPMFTKIWDSKYNPPGAVKYFLGLMLLGIGFGLLAFSARGIGEGNEFKVSMIWLILAYLFHTLGELCISPVGLSYLSKLIPARMIAFMFGVYYLAIAIGNKLAHYIGGDLDKITSEYSLSTFFLIFTIVPFVLAIIALLLNPVIKKLMHGVK